MPRKTRRRIRRKRVRGTRRVRTYYRGGNRRYNGEGGDIIGDLYEKITSAATSASNRVRTILYPNTSETSLLGSPPSPPL
jgi:hypothetical protein